MSLLLHSTYSFDDAVAGFEGEPQFFCDRQFAVLPDSVLCFVTIGDTKDESLLASPTTVVWRPGRLDYEPETEDHSFSSWLPTPVQKVYEHVGDEVVCLRHHHLFVRHHQSAFWYVGEAHLGMYGIGCYGPEKSGRNRQARFSLRERIPRDVWLDAGGYQGWCVDVEHQESIVAEDDFEQFDALLEQLAAQDFSHLRMTRYEEDRLKIFKNPNCAWVMYSRDFDDNLYLHDSAKGRQGELFMCSCGIDLEFPASQTVSHKRASEVAKHFFRTGKLVDELDWHQSAHDLSL